jgi:hypothetical protein
MYHKCIKFEKKKCRIKGGEFLNHIGRGGQV